MNMNMTTSRSLLNIKVIGQRSRSRGFCVFWVHDIAATCGQYLVLSNAWRSCVCLDFALYICIVLSSILVYKLYPVYTMKLARRAGSLYERTTSARRAASWMFAILHHSNDQIASSSSQLYEPASSCKRGITHVRVWCVLLKTFIKTHKLIYKRREEDGNVL